MKTVFGLFGLVVLITFMCLQSQLATGNKHASAAPPEQDADFDPGD